MTAVIAFVALPPTAFFAGIVTLLALGLLGWAMALERSPVATINRARATVQPWIQSERRTAANLGLAFPTWVGGRVVVALVAVLAGFTSHIFVLTVLGFFAGYYGTAWVGRELAGKRQLRRNEAVIGTWRDLAARMSQGRGFDAAVRDVAANPRPELLEAMAPFRSEMEVALAIVEMIERSQSALAEQAGVSLVIGRIRNQQGLHALLDGTLVDIGAAALEIEREEQTAATQQRTRTAIMAAISALTLYGITRLPEFNAVYTTFGGQVVLTAAAGMFLGCIFLMERSHKKPAWTPWNLRAVRKEFSRFG